jgi:dipeptidyl aminopeptidase/acylaminoacyl peptidase
MWMTYPPGFDRSKRYPLFLLIHGGPHSGITDSWTWRWNAQVFAGWGYVVAWPNFHGSSGFGDAFTDSINPDWMEKPYADVIAAGNWFAGQPWIDRERMVAGGGSYGGYLTTVLLGREHPFKALVAHAAVYNMYAQLAGDWGGEQPRFPEYWERKEEFERISPHVYAANFKTPTLVIHGQQDQRVPVAHGLELFQTLQRRGVPSRFIYYPDENHWILTPQNSIFWYGEVRRWIEQYAPPGGR